MSTALWTNAFLILNLGDCFSTNTAPNQGASEANLQRGKGEEAHPVNSREGPGLSPVPASLDELFEEE